MSSATVPALSLPPPASLKKTQLGFWLSAMTNSAADRPPCDPDTTTALACALLMCAIESSKNNCDLTPIKVAQCWGQRSAVSIDSLAEMAGTRYNQDL